MTPSVGVEGHWTPYEFLGCGIVLITVGLCCDRNCILPALVTLTSLASSIGPRERSTVGVSLILADVTRTEGESVAAVVARLGYSSCTVARAHFPALPIINGRYISRATWLRFRFSSTIVPSPLFCYLDTDTLVLDDPMGPFEAISAGGVALVRDAFNHSVGAGPALPGLADDRPELIGRPYFNAGAIWLSSDRLTPLSAGSLAAFHHGRRFMHFNDQDALNLHLLLDSSATEISGEYNQFEYDRSLQRGDWVRRVVNDTSHGSPRILHFVGPDKPWLRSCPRVEWVRVYRVVLAEACRQIRRAGALTLERMP
jgi:lipopolysaccharide biosynthesis glycosyltransferase